ncbi:protein ASPARTIC PROTEASE IN GUARD CELL 1 [Ziziphus jujuba]|uniref:Protein ASPARTIC PROTEASE IN GUARD CELL 1 n=2 Tax=Ziziphus jujuba TaxID=326968 RepID=A0ABM3IJN8_ZIZJJ|nr:protein ASPARTIC PROTEASE IN GUARD CELL 1 [Ziziphus jujuba]KAH7528781.1 hypothetical protein FEM48_Zijuj05G0108700 [Ziziphus jujuba var. spinosa]
MAANPFLFFFILSVFTFSVFSSVFSRSLSNPSDHPLHTTAVLDVSASLKLAHEVLSFDPQTLKPFDDAEQSIPTNFSSSASFSVLLFPRDSLHNSKHDDYRSLFLSRIERDAARVESINTKLQFLLNNVSKSDLEPVVTEIRPEDLSTPVVSGTSQGSGEYFSRIGVGRPAKSFYMVLDTGSDINWLQCEPCSDCYQQSDPIFNPTSSSSYQPLTCESQQCNALQVSACRNGRCLYQVSYGDGSYTVGDFATETVSFGNSGSVNNVALGCGHDNEGLFVGSAGLLGLGGGHLSLPSQIKAATFSYCLVDRDSGGSSTLEFNSARPSDSVTAPLLRNGNRDTFYYVGLTGIGVGGQLLSIPPSLFEVDESGNGGIIVDSGTAITRLQTQAYESLRDAFKSKAPQLPATSGVALFDTCYDLSSRTSVKVPTVSFHFTGGKSLNLPAKNYLIPVDNSGTFCFAFAPTTSSLSIIGNVQQQGTRVSFDLANSLVGFSPNKC